MKLKPSYASQRLIPDGFADLYTVADDDRATFTAIDGLKPAADLEALQSTNDELAAQLTTRDLQVEVSSLGAGLGLSQAVVEDLQIHAESELIRGPDGVFATQDGQTAASWAQDMVAARPHWTGSGSTQSGDIPSGRDNPWSKAGWNITNQGRVMAGGIDRAKQMAAEAGVDVHASRPAA